MIPRAIKFWVLAAGIFLLLAGCRPDKPGKLKVQLEGYFGNQPLSFTNTIYSDSISKQYFFNALQFYVSHFSLIKNDNSLVEIKDVSYFGYTEPEWRSFTVDVPPGEYKGIQFSIGLDPQQNDTDPAQYPESHPLGPKNNMYWSWLKHRFIVLEGKADDIGGTFASGTGLQYHVGRDTCYRTVTIMGPALSVSKKSSQEISLNLDVRKIFYGPQGSMDAYQYPGTQSEDNDLGTAILFADQFSKAFSYSK